HDRGQRRTAGDSGLSKCVLPHHTVAAQRRVGTRLASVFVFVSSFSFCSPLFSRLLPAFGAYATFSLPFLISSAMKAGDFRLSRAMIFSTSIFDKTNPFLAGSKATPFIAWAW